MSISVVIPAYNAAGTLQETLDSIAAQSTPVDEVIVVDDGSSDATAQIAGQHPLRPRVLPAQHRGAAAALNAGIQATHGSYLAFLDADDLWLPEKTRLQQAILDANPELAGTVGYFSSFVCPSVPASEAARFTIQPPQAGWLSGALMARADAFRQAGLFSEDLSNGFVIDWFDRARNAKLNFKVTDDLVLQRRLHPGSLSARSRSSDSAMLEMARRALARRRAQQGS